MRISVWRVFDDFIPDVDSYILTKFSDIAPNFNTRDVHEEFDIDYLIKFIVATEEVLGIKYNLDQTPNGIICEFIVKSIQKYFDDNKSDNQI